jgi:hypothetical protein
MFACRLSLTTSPNLLSHASAPGSATQQRSDVLSQESMYACTLPMTRKRPGRLPGHGARYVNADLWTSTSCTAPRLANVGTLQDAYLTTSSNHQCMSDHSGDDCLRAAGHGQIRAKHAAMLATNTAGYTTDNHGAEWLLCKSTGMHNVTTAHPALQAGDLLLRPRRRCTRWVLPAEQFYGN